MTRFCLLAILAAACATDAAHVLDRADPATARECPDGGTVVRSGPDDDGDGALDDGEVTTEQVICREALLSRVGEAAITAACPGGGLAFHSGRDRNGNGDLDPDEIERTERECGDVLARDLVVRSDDEMALVTRLRAIDGSLHIGGPGLTRVSLPALTRVRDEMWIRGEAIEAIELPALEQVGARRGDWDLVISGNPALAALTLALPACDDTSIKILDNPALTSLDLTCPGLRRLEVQDNRALGAARIDVGLGAGTVVVRGNDALEDLALAGTSLEGLHVTERGLPGLGIAELLAIDSVAIDAPIRAMPVIWGSPYRVSLTGTRLAAVELGASEIRLANNPDLVSARVRGVSWLMVEGHPRLASVELGAGELFLPTIIALVDNPALTAAPWLADLCVIESLQIRGNPRLAVPARWDLLGAGVVIELADVMPLRHLAVYAAELGGLDIAATGLETLQVVAGGAGDSEAPGVSIVANPALAVAHVDVPLDAWRDSRIVIGGNRVLADLRLRVPAQARQVSIVDNPALSSCQAAAMLEATVATVEEQHGNNEAVMCAP